MAPRCKTLHVIPSLHYLLWILTGVHGIAFGQQLFSSSSAGSTDAGVLNFVNSCMGPMSKAGLDCPCSRIGGQCRDPLSICDLTHHCKCDGRIGYLAASGTVCLEYPVPNTTATPCPVVTCPACPTTTSLICPAVTCPAYPTTTSLSTTTCPVVTCPTTMTTTTTTTTTTTAPQPTTCPNPGGFAYPTSLMANPQPNAFVAGCGACIIVPATGSAKLNCPKFGTVAGAIYAQCLYAISAPAGKNLRFIPNFGDFTFPGNPPNPPIPPNLEPCAISTIFIGGITYCNERLPPAAGILVPASSTAVSFLAVNPVGMIGVTCEFSVIAE